MRFSATIAAIAILAAQPAFSVPILASFPSNGVNLTPTSTRVFPSQSFLDHFKNRVHSLREVNELMEREELAGFARELEDLFARADEDESGAAFFDTLKKVFKVGGIALDGLNIAGNLFPGSSQPQPSAAPAQRRDFEELYSRELEERLFNGNAGLGVVPTAPFSGHGPFRFTSFPSPIVGTIRPNVRREFVELLVRQLADDESGATLASTLGKVFGKVKDIFKDGKKLDNLANGASIVSDATTIAGNLIPGKSQAPPPAQSGAPQARELVELLARQLADDESGATFASSFGKIVDTVKNVFKDGKTLGKIADGASIASSASSILGGLIHPAPPAQSQAPQARELMDSMLARAMEARELNELD
ncbi:hypothetical protein BDY19DRAFT_989700 [Irpex rosettiformis]|uniref:Uncharacterized protein n=1 Tax=Irpex rosettiformis TaxID=378272 RepID=A0ACB8UFG3_9APHY|nr:hypothetical protein BDY19DRAFT_989700 [Irpex rosettiformis]